MSRFLKSLTVFLLVGLWFVNDGLTQSNDDWNWQNPLPQGNTLNDVLFVDGNSGWAVGLDGTVLHTSDGGSNWTEQASGTSSPLYGVHFADATAGWAVGLDGTILQTSDGGTNWVAQTSGTTNTLRDVYFTDVNTGWAIGNSGVILHTNDGGTNWVAQSSGVGNTLIGVYFTDSNTGWVVGDQGVILQTSDAGTNWVSQTSGTTDLLWGVHFADSNTGWAVGDNGVVLQTSDGGSNWGTQTSGTTDSLRGVHFTDSSTGWIVGQNGRILQTSDGGSNWVAQTSSTTDFLFGLNFTDSNTGWVVGQNGIILNTIDAGTTWNSQSSGTTNQLWGVHFIDNSTGWAVGDIGVILKTGDGGSNWVEQTSGTTNLLYRVYSTDSNTAWVVGSSGLILHTTDGGSNWVEQTSGTTNTLIDVYFTDSNSGWAVGASGTILHTGDGGSNWTEQASGTSSPLYGVHFADNNNGWAVGNSGLILHTIDGGATWNSQISGTSDALNGVNFIDSSTGYAVGNNGTFVQTSDGGSNWSAQNIGTSNSMRNIHFTDSSTGWAVGENGTILQTSDGGSNWVTQNSGTSNTLIDVHFSGSSNGWAVGQNGTILNFEDTGTLGPVTLLSPSNEITNVGVTPTLSWEAEAGADTYSLELSTDSAFGTAVISETNITQTSFEVLTELAEGTVYYWRVRGVEQDGTEGEWSDVWQFTTETADEIHIYSGSQDNTVRKIDSLGNELWSFTGHTGWVYAVAVGSDGNVYSGSEDNTVRKIDSAGNELWSFSGHTGWVYAVAVDSDGNVYSGSQDHTVRKIDSAGNEVWSFTGHTNYVNAVAVDSDGNVYSGSLDNTVRKIDSAGNELWSFTGHTDNVKSVAVDSDGNVYSGSTDNTVRKIDSAGNEVWSFTGHTFTVHGVALGSDGNVYSVSGDGTVRKIDPNGTEVWSFTGHTNAVFSVEVDAEGNVYSGSGDNTVRKIDSDGTEVWSFTGHTGSVRDVAVTPESFLPSPQLATPLDGATEVELQPTFSWQPVSGASSYRIQVSTSAGFSQTSIDSSGISGTELQSVVSLNANSTYYWRVRGIDSEGNNGNWSEPFSFSTETQALERFIVTGSSDNEVHKLDASGNQLWTFTGHTSSVNDIFTDENGFIYSASADNTVRKIDPDGNELWSFSTPNSVFSVLTDNNGNVYFGSWSLVTKLDPDGNIIWEYTQHSSWVNDLAIDESGFIYSASSDNSVHKIDENGNQVWVYAGHANNVNAVAVDQLGNVYTGDSDNQLHKIDLNGNQVWIFTEHSTSIFSVSVDSNGDIYSGSSNGIRKKDADANQLWLYTGLNNTVYSIEIDENGLIYAGSSASEVHLLDSNRNLVWDYNEHTDWVNGVAFAGAITPSQQIALNTPVDDAIDQPTRPTFEWDADAAAESYTITISDNNLFDPFTIQDTVTETSYVPSVDLASGREYIWKVNGTDINGNKKWSEVSSFTVEQSERYIFSGSSDNTIKKLDLNGSEVWSYSFGATVNAVVADDLGNVYGAGGNNVHKIDEDGLQVWTYELHTSTITSLAIDDEGFIYSGSFDNTVHKIDPNGNQVWVYDFGTTVRAVAADEGNVYATSTSRLDKINQDGLEIWSRSTGISNTFVLEVDAQGNVYLNSNTDVLKIDSNGNTLWTYTEHVDAIRGLAVDLDGNIYSGSLTEESEVHKIDTNGNQVWVYADHIGGINSLAVDISGFVYSASIQDSTGARSVHQINQNGENVWIFDGHTNGINSVSVSRESSTLGQVVLSEPLADATGLSVKPEFRWEALSGALTYELRVSRSNIFEGTSVRENGITETNFTLPFDLREQQTYYWKVRGAGADGVKGEWSPTFSFTTEDLAFAGGDGSVGNPYQISTTGQLQLVRDNSDQNFIVINDIDARTTREWNDGQGFNPIGDNVVRFSGRFNGNGYTISNLFINRSGQGDVGTFGNVNSQAIIQNVNIENISITGGDFSVGGLAGFSDGEIRNVTVSGSIRNTGDNTGGIVGAQGGSGLIYGSRSHVNIDVNAQRIGGLVGEMFGDIENSFSTGRIIGGQRDVGGLVGRSFSNTLILRSHATGDVSTRNTGSFIEYFGGLIGRNESLISGSYSTGNVEVNGSYIGGLAGDNTGNGEIIVSFSTGSVNGNFATGGFAGRNNGSIEQSYALGNVEGRNDTGGFIGENNNSVTNVFAKGNVIGDDQTGGLIGGNRNGSVVSRAYAWGSVTGVNSVGGLIGVNPEGNEVNNSYSRGLVSGTEDVGGFIGLNAGIIDSSYWDFESSERGSGIGRGPTSGVTGLPTAEMTGQEALDFMTLFNFEDDWKVADTYPALIWETIGVPLLISPANNALGLSLFPEFEWSIDSDAVSYDLQVGRTSTFPEELALNESGIATNTFSSTTELSPGAGYSWRVRIEREGGDKGDWSEPFNFTTAATVNAANSSVIATTPHAPDGLDASVVTVRLRNDFNVLVDGFTEADFDITISGGAIATPIAETETAGVYRFELTSDTPTVATVQILADGVQLDDEPLVIFTDDEPELFLFSTSLDSTVRRTDIDGNTIWSSSVDIEWGLRTSTITPNEELYVGGNERPDIFKFDFNGNLEDVISISGGIGIYSLTSDEEGFIYAATRSSNTYKISPAGSVLWSHGGDQNGDYSNAEDIVYDPEGFVYVAHWEGNVKKLDTDGNLIWEFVQGNESGNYNLVSIAVDNTGNVYVGNSDGGLRKLDSNGDFVWEYNGFTNFVFEIEFDSENNVYAGGADSEVHKLDQDGNLLWVASTDGRWVEGINVDRNDNLFVGAWRTLLKLDTETGEEIWSNDSHSAQIRGLSTGYFIQTGTGVVTLSQPENGANNVSLLPVFSWEQAIGASSYRFQLSTDNEFTDIINSEDGILNTTVSFANELDPESTYYWRTKGVDGLGIEGDWSDTFSFTTLSVDQVYSQLMPQFGIQNPNAPLELRFNFGIVLSSIFDAITITDSENITYTLSIDEPNPGQFMIATEEKFFAGDQITVNINSSLLQSTSGFDITGNDTTFTFNTSFLGDFSETGSVDSEDLMQIASRWRVSGDDQDITEFDIGPATGTPPRMKSNPDGVINFEDLVIFAFSWGRSLEDEIGGAMASAPLSGMAGNRIVDQELESLDELRETTEGRDPDMASAFALSYDVDTPFTDFTDRLGSYYEDLKQREESQSRQLVELRTPARTEQYQRMNEQTSATDRTMALVLSENHMLQGYELLVNLPDGVTMNNVQVNTAFEQHGGQTFSLKQTSTRGFVLSVANLGQPLELTAGDTLATFTANSADSDVADMSIAYTIYQTPDESVKGMYNMMADLPADVPDQFQVLQNFPNPFNPTTEIRYQLPEQAEVRIRVYDILGRLVFTIAEQQVEAGFYQVSWDASRYASGVYLYVIQARGASGQTYMQTKKMTLIK